MLKIKTVFLIAVLSTIGYAGESNYDYVQEQQQEQNYRQEQQMQQMQWDQQQNQLMQQQEYDSQKINSDSQQRILEIERGNQ